MATPQDIVEYDLNINLVLIGDSDVGKSTILYSCGLSHDMLTGVGVGFNIKTIELKGKRIRLQIWDTCSQKRFPSITNTYYRGAQGIILFYDITRQESFGSVARWLQDIKGHASGVELLLIGCWCDLKAKRVVAEEQGAALALSLGIPFLETSAVASCNIDAAFKQLAKQILSKVRMKQLIPACTDGRLHIVRSVLSATTYDPECIDEEGNTPLHLACASGHSAIVRLLVHEKGCDINCQANDGSTPLHRACSSGRIDIIKFLLQQRCDTRIQNKRGQSPQTIFLNRNGDRLLHIACQWGDMNIIKYLVHNQRCDTRVPNKKGQNPQTIPLNESGDLLLHIACQWGDLDTVRYLVCQQHCDVNVQNKNSDSPLHIACYYEGLDIIKFLLHQRCDTRVQNKKGQPPQSIVLNEDGDRLLHIACQWGDVDIVKYLVHEQHCDVNVQNRNSDSPLHIACYYKCLDIIEFLLHQRCDTRVQNKRRQCPQTIPLNEDNDLLLHIVCQWGDAGLVRYLVCEQYCDVNVQNKNGDSPLHIACYCKCLDIIEFLLHQRCDTRVQNKRRQCPQTIPLNEDNDLLLHIVCQWGDMNIIKYLVHNQRCDTRVQNKKGQNPQTIPLNESGDLLLHIACQWGDLDTVRYLVCQQHCDVNVRNKNDDSPLHAACQGESLDIMKYLITEQQCNVNVRNMNSDSLLHVACKGKNLDIVKYLITEQHCDVNVWNKTRSSPLHVAIVSHQPSIALHLLCHEHCNLILPDLDGNTPLHLACMKCVHEDTKMLQVARLLLSSTDLSACINNAGQTPVELTTNYQLIQYISHITKCMTKHSIQTFVKLFFIGNPSTGKSTLVEAVSREKSWFWKLLPHWFSRVRNVPLHTAGIVPITFRSKKFGNTVLYDMAGQYEYYSSHAAVIENTVLSSAPGFVVVVDLSESDDKIAERLKYWWSFIDNHATRSITTVHVILIGSHADVVKASGVSVQGKMSIISSVLRGLSSSFHFAGQVALDCRDPISSGLGQFCSLVEKSCTALRQAADIDLRCHVAYSFLLETFKGRVACTVSDIAAQISATDTLLPQNPDELVHLLSSLSDKGLVLLVKTSSSIEESWVILQKQDLLSEFNGTIFAPENFRQHRVFARSTGVVPFSRIKREFLLYDSAMLTGFLTHLEFCFKIDDPETLQRIEGEAPKGETSLDPTDEYYFFPALVSVDNPHHVWQPDDSMVDQCGWYYKCHADQFLSPRFLHVLILRLAFTFALGLDKQHQPQNVPVLCRRCSVWKHGIGWLQDGIEIVVEVGLQCQWVTVVMRCLKGKEVKCVQLRSAVVQEVKKASTELCKAVRMTESLIGPLDVHYPFSDEHVSLYSLTDISNAMATEETHVIDQQGHNSIPIQDLVIFEPYLGVGPNLLDELFHHDTSDKLVSKSFLEHLASHVHPQMSFFEKVVNPQPIMRYQKELENESLPASKCLVLLQWLLRKLENPTYDNFHKELDNYSIFCGRNPMEIADAKVVASIPCMGLGSPRSDPNGVQYTQHGASENAGEASSAEVVNTANTITAEEMDCIPEETPTIKDLMNLPIPSWYSLGIQLGIQPSKLKNIQANGAQFPDFAERCTADMFQWWLSNDGSPTYRSLVKGLLAAGMTDAVRLVHNRYGKIDSSWND